MLDQPEPEKQKKKRREPMFSLRGPLPLLYPDEKTLNTLRGLGRIQCTLRECAAVLGVDYVTFMKFKKRWSIVQEILDKGREEGLASLRRTQFRHAEENTAMAIFLGKNYLGQSDRLDQRVDANVAMDMTTTWVFEPRPQKTIKGPSDVDP